jgi:Na+/H+ antiporter NhaD/arsenite permease-like protein
MVSRWPRAARSRAKAARARSHCAGFLGTTLDSIVTVVFVLTYLGMAAGRVPGLRLTRAGIALLAVTVLLVSGAGEVADLGRYLDAPTLLLLFALMILSGQFTHARFYDWCAARIAFGPASPKTLLALVVAVSGLLSAVLANDIVVFAMAPILCLGARERGLDPRPFLIALAGASNAGSAATLIGNPQNILIGQVGHLDFWAFFVACAPPALLAMVAVYAVVAWIWRAELNTSRGVDSERTIPQPDTWQTGKGALAAIALLVLFATPMPREVVGLMIAAALLVSRRVASRDILNAVDWHLLLLFACLFVVTGRFAESEAATAMVTWLERADLLPESLALMAPLALVVSNAIGNVPAVILILKLWPAAPEGALYALALLSTLAGNLLLLGSLANIIVAERAASVGVRLGFVDHARCGIPMTLISMAIAVIWLGLTGILSW